MPKLSEDELRMDMASLRRDELVAKGGRRYSDFRRTLTPRYTVAYLQILAGYIGVITSASIVIAFQNQFVLLAILGVVIGAAGIGYWVHYLHLFLHEGAHYHLAPSRGLNDLLSNVFLGVLTGHDVRSYRRVHFQHHRHLGTPEDTERSYFDPLNLRFFIEALTGVRLLRAMLTWSRGAAPEGAKSQTAYFTIVTVISAILNMAIVLGSIALGSLALAVAWCLGIFLFLPLVMAVRQVVEHRSLHADPEANYQEIPHGQVNRLFGSGPLASTLGSAGFNRHLLHHWEPQLSCTRLAELESFLLETHSAAVIQEHQTSYLATFRGLLAAGRTNP